MGEWRFLLDENIDLKTATYLLKEAIHAEHVLDALGQGADDEETPFHMQEHTISSS